MAKKEPVSASSPSESSEQSAPEQKQKVFAKHIDLGVGLHMLGAKLSLQAVRGTTLEVTPLGVLAVSGKNSRKILIPWANIKGMEFMPEAEVKVAQAPKPSPPKPPAGEAPQAKVSMEHPLPVKDEV